MFDFFSFIFLLLLFLSLFCFFGFFLMICSGSSLIVDWEMFSFNGITFLYSLVFDWVSLLFLGSVLFISSCVFKYSSEYMSHDYNKFRFGLLVFFFVFSMVLLIVSPNFISVILGWDGLGLVSYCLVIYYMNYKSNSAGMVTVLTNRLGDSGLIICVSLFLCFGSLEFLNLIFVDVKLGLFIGMGCFLAAITKSAQIPFSSWLPAAMAAPTPVSALVHSSTLVTAGVFLLIRFFPLLDSLVLSVLFYLSTLTVFMSSLGALFEFDMKKIIALSTLSQLGLMMFTLSLGYYLFSYMHLLTHAMFKSLLFLCAGVFIHGSSGFQDIRFFGYVSGMFPYVSFLMVSSSLALCGFPFLAGFYSKDKILESCVMSELNLVCVFFLFISVLMTSVYSFRLIKSLFISEQKIVYGNMSDYGVLVLPMFLLMVGAVIFGSLLSWVCLDVPYLNLPEVFKILLIFVIFGGIYLGFVMVGLISVGSFAFFLGSMWFLGYLSTYVWSKIYFNLGFSFYKLWDMGWNEFWGPQGMYKFIFYSSETIFVSYNYKVYLFTFILWGFVSCFLFF